MVLVAVMRKLEVFYAVSNDARFGKCNLCRVLRVTITVHINVYRHSNKNGSTITRTVLLQHILLIGFVHVVGYSILNAMYTEDYILCNH